MRKLIIPAILVALAICVAPVLAAEPAKPETVKPVLAAEPAKPETMEVGSTLLELKTMDMEGNPVTLSSLVKPNMLNVIAFTNSTCYACATELSVLSSIKGKNMDKMNLIGVVTDISPGSYKALPEGVKKAFSSFVHDAEFQITPLFGFSSTPATALVKGGKIIDLKTGFDPAKSAEFAVYIEKNL
jgi:hypothetical protein